MAPALLRAPGPLMAGTARRIADLTAGGLDMRSFFAESILLPILPA